MSVSSSLGLVFALLAIAGCGTNENALAPDTDTLSQADESRVSATFSHPTQLFGDAQTYIDQIETLNREIPEEPDNSGLRMQRGLAYKNLIMLSLLSSLAPAPDAPFVTEWEAQARADFDFVIERNPENARAYFERATLSNMSYAGTADRTSSAQQKIGDLTAAIELDPQNGEYYEYRALNYWELKNYDEAVTDFAKAINFTADSTQQADMKLMRGRMYAEQGQFELALKDYDEGLEVLPEFQQAVEEREEIRKRISQKK